MRSTTLPRAALAVAAALPVSAASVTSRHYPLPDHGQFILSVPDSWIEEVGSPQPGEPTALWFTPRSGASFNVLVTPTTARTPGSTVSTSRRDQSLNEARLRIMSVVPLPLGTLV
jgi:hypothetical protein